MGLHFPSAFFPRRKSFFPVEHHPLVDNTVRLYLLLQNLRYLMQQRIHLVSYFQWVHFSLSLTVAPFVFAHAESWSTDLKTY